MTYKQPEVAVLGDAVSVIESLPSPPFKNDTSSDDGSGKIHNSAYDLDE